MVRNVQFVLKVRIDEIAVIFHILFPAGVFHALDGIADRRAVRIRARVTELDRIGFVTGLGVHAAFRHLAPGHRYGIALGGDGSGVSGRVVALSEIDVVAGPG